MQYRLSTIFLIFFVVATSLAMFGEDWILGLVVAACLCLSAYPVYRFKSMIVAIPVSMVILSIAVFGGYYWGLHNNREAVRSSKCHVNLRSLGVGLLNHQSAKKDRFPLAITRDKEGYPLYSWLFATLPFWCYNDLYDALNKNEPWNSITNTEALRSFNRLWKYTFCPSYPRNNKDFSSNYLTIIGPGTIWRKEDFVKRPDLPVNGSHTIMLVEGIDPDRHHWAEPFVLTVEEVLENTRTGKGARIASYHPGHVNMLAANLEVYSLPSKMQLSLWRKILQGEIDDFAKIESLNDPNAPDAVELSLNPHRGVTDWQFILSVAVWLFSVVLLFRRTVRSRGIALVE